MSPAWMLQALAAGALLGVGALAAERVAGWLGLPRRPVWAAAMLGSLLLPALSLWAPGLLPDPGIFPGAAPPAPAFDAGALPLAAGGGAPAASTATPAAAAWWPDPAVALGLAWAAASLAMLAVVAWTYRRLRRASRAGARVDLEGGEVRVTERVGPAVVGLLHPAVVVPRWVLAAPAEDRRLVLLHEREHVAAGDVWLLFLGTLAAAAMPWSVALWWQHRRLRAAVEADCDARVLARGVSRRDYGQVLIRTAGATPGLPLLGPAWGDTTSQLERRILAMTAKRPSHPLLRSLPLLALAAAVATAACDVVAGAEAEATLSAEPASLRVAMEASLGAAGAGPAADTLPPLRALPPLPPMPPAAPDAPPPADAPDAPPAPPALPALVAPAAPPALTAVSVPAAPPAPARSVRPAPAAPPALVAPRAPRAVPGRAPAPTAPPAARAPAPTVLLVADTLRAPRMSTTTTVARTTGPRPTASLGWAPRMPLAVSDASGRLRMVDYPVVAGLKHGGGAWRAGVRDGDVVLGVNGQDARELPAVASLGRSQPGTRYTVRVRRDGVVRDLTAELDAPRAR